MSHFLLSHISLGSRREAGISAGRRVKIEKRHTRMVPAQIYHGLISFSVLAITPKMVVIPQNAYGVRKAHLAFAYPHRQYCRSFS
jgi:hypothetical protein